jgi:hypothetical protein
MPTSDTGMNKVTPEQNAPELNGSHAASPSGVHLSPKSDNATPIVPQPGAKV